MSIYNKSGAEIDYAYELDGAALSAVYDVNANLVFPNVIKVMTYNVQWFTEINAQQAMQASIINGYDPDIIGFQEFSQNGAIPSVGTNILQNYPTKKLSNHKNYMAFASKKPLSNYVIADFTNQDPEDASRYNETRAYMVCDFQFGGKTVKWINTHLCYLTQSYKWLQMGEILSIANGYVGQGYPVIITGDFNNTALSTADDDYIQMFKPFVDAGYNLANCSPDAGFTNTWTNSTSATSFSQMTDPADSIIVSSDISIESVVFDPTKFSYLNGNPIDHIAIFATLRITGAS